VLNLTLGRKSLLENGLVGKAAIEPRPPMIDSGNRKARDVMEFPADSKQTIRFGPYVVDLRTGELRKKGLKVRLQGKSFQILAALLEHPGELVTREELRQRLWSCDTFVDWDNGLNTALTKLREALNDSAENPRYIETIPKRGYRFVAPVREAGSHRLIMLVVLPFENLSDDTEQEYFSDGLTEEMITRLARLNPERLGVIARTSSMRYKKTNKRISEIARELNVDWVLEGSVRRGAERARITAQIIRAEDQSHLWAQSYDRDLRDILLVQTEVALAVAQEIRLKLEPGVQVKSKNERRVNRDAHHWYLMGRYHIAKFSQAGFTKGIEYLQRSIEIEPDFAPAYDGLAFSYLLASGWFLPPSEAMLKAKVAAMKALAIDDGLAEAHASLGIVHLRYDWDWQAAERECRRAVELNTGSARANELYGWYLAAMGRFDEAIAEERRALELDPVSPVANTLLGHVLYLARRYDQAVEQLEKAVELDRNYWFAHHILGLSKQQQGKILEALEEFKEATRLEPVGSEAKGALGQAYAVLGEYGEARKILEELRDWAKRNYVSPFNLARIYAALGEEDQAFACLEQAYRERSFFLSWFKVEPALDPLRREPCFEAMLGRLSFPV
jgi:TolB-like protein/Tfp pilus assembly protein PilF